MKKALLRKLIWVVFFYWLSRSFFQFSLISQTLKAHFASILSEKIGYELNFDGDLELSIFPAIKLEATKVGIKNNRPFLEPLFVNFDKLDVAVDWLAILLSKKININNLVF